MTNRSLVLFDELGRGTSTYEGVSIAWAVIEYIHNHPQKRGKTLFSTRNHELIQLAELLPGGSDRSYGIHVAQMAGTPRLVIQRANEILAQLRASAGKAVEINPMAAQQMALFPQTNPQEILSSTGCTFSLAWGPPSPRPFLPRSGVRGSRPSPWKIETGPGGDWRVLENTKGEIF